ncbi:MAG: hypothetical protein IT204_23820 [Fimbriimonadaceae bacterium]|nr:hypothetical protein [Fimbriimonadaceae bacterium]
MRYRLPRRCHAAWLSLLLITLTGALAQTAEPAKPAPPPADAAKPAVDAEGRPLVSNVFFETDMRQALSDVAAQTKTVIVPDDSVQGAVSVELKDAPLETALELICLRGGYVYEKIAKDTYLVTAPDPKSPNFHRIAKTQVIELNYAKAEEIKSQLPESMVQYVRSAEPDTRLVVTAPGVLLPNIEAAIKALDTPQTQVLIEALVVETRSGTGLDFSWSAQSKHLGLDIGTGLATYVDAAATVLYRVMALVENNQGEIKATPRVITQQGRKASVRVALQQYFSLVSGRLGFEYVTLQAIESGTGLVITPQIALADRMVTCQIEPEVGDVTGTGADNLPIITKRTASTTVRVRDGEVIAIGGLLQSIEREIRRKVPILGDIPILGDLFRSRRDVKEQREVTIFVVPHILDADGRFTGQLLSDTLRAGGALVPEAASTKAQVQPPTAMPKK